MNLLALQNLDNSINFKGIHKALLKDPNGVPAKTFIEDGATGIPKRVCMRLREFQAFLYHYPSEEYRYAGKEYEKAAKEIWAVLNKS